MGCILTLTPKTRIDSITSRAAISFVVVTGGKVAKNRNGLWIGLLHTFSLTLLAWKCLLCYVY